MACPYFLFSSESYHLRLLHRGEKEPPANAISSTLMDLLNHHIPIVLDIFPGRLPDTMVAGPVLYYATLFLGLKPASRENGHRKGRWSVIFDVMIENDQCRIERNGPTNGTKRIIPAIEA